MEHFQRSEALEIMLFTFTFPSTSYLETEWVRTHYNLGKLISFNRIVDQVEVLKYEKVVGKKMKRKK